MQQGRKKTALACLVIVGMFLWSSSIAGCSLAGTGKGDGTGAAAAGKIDRRLLGSWIYIEDKFHSDGISLRPDGTYHETTVNHTPILNERYITSIDGKYKVDGDRITFYASKAVKKKSDLDSGENVPAPDVTKVFEVINSDKIVLEGLEYKRAKE